MVTRDLGIIVTTCPVCGKRFALNPDWVFYKYRDPHHRKAVCSWRCARASEAERDAKRIYKKRDRKDDITDDLL